MRLWSVRISVSTPRLWLGAAMVAERSAFSESHISDHAAAQRVCCVGPNRTPHRVERTPSGSGRAAFAGGVSPCVGQLAAAAVVVAR